MEIRNGAGELRRMQRSVVRSSVCVSARWIVIAPAALGAGQRAYEPEFYKSFAKEVGWRLGQLALRASER